MNFIPKNIQKAIEEFSKLPGIGPKSAERLVFYLLKKPEAEVTELGEAISSLKKEIRYCTVCQHLTTEELCDICRADGRNKETVCVVEDSLDLMALEKANEYKGLYHVLHGIISPIDGIGPDELTIAELIRRAKAGGIKEMILALNPSMEGEATAAYISRYIKPFNIKLTRIARGIPVGGNLEYADSQTLKRAMEGRIEY
ncbi:recombination mediator RecR [Patescibacteria group bacterium]|nr:recombination mediator RecR [Patescibacteria group bacterium]MBU1015873.1 recombination mediator RecR [Patescibacteria group bacterium]MBU1685378.1 recombination mediator RecR [Patescibacteria group bacterium]MBU1938463.1 recombination mediator RecR [Patescibacteria group bacterium]